MGYRLLAAVFATCLVAMGQSLTVEKLLAFLQSSEKLIAEGKMTDRDLANYLAKVKLTERLDDRTIEEIQGSEKLGPKTLAGAQPAPRPEPVPGGRRPHRRASQAHPHSAALLRGAGGHPRRSAAICPELQQEPCRISSAPRSRAGMRRPPPAPSTAAASIASLPGSRWTPCRSASATSSRRKSTS